MTLKFIHSYVCLIPVRHQSCPSTKHVRYHFYDVSEATHAQSLEFNGLRRHIFVIAKYAFKVTYSLKYYDAN